MALLKIARMGHPVLLTRAEPVAEIGDPDVQRLVGDMIETMHDAGGVGLAAPQVHESRRIIVFHVPAPRAGEGQTGVPVTVLINPEIEPIGDAMVGGWEGCLSIPGLRGAVPRWKSIRYAGLSPAGEPVAGEAHDFHARVIQHEVDHLDGVLYPMRMPDLSRLMFIEEWERAMEQQR